MKALIVDDEADIRESTAMLLEMLGYDVETVGDVQQVVDVAKRFAPDVILHDVHMPGLELESHLATLRASLAGVPIVLFTASVRVEDVEHMQGVRAVLPKPFDVDRLEQALHQAIA